MKREWFLILCLVVFGGIPFHSWAEGTIKTLGGSLGITSEWDSNIYLDDKDEESAWLYGALGTLRYEDEGQFRRISLEYNVRARQNSRTNDSELEHSVRLFYDKDLSRYFSVDLTNTFNTGYDTLTQGVRGQRLYKRRNRKRYYTNAAQVSGVITYGERRSWNFGYGNQYYESSGNYSNDYMRHEFFTNLEHRFTVRYGLVVGAQYEKGDFKDTADTEGEHFDIGLAHYINPHDTIYLTYGYSNFTYRDDRPDYTTQTVSLAWTRQVTEKDTMHASLGASYWENDKNDSDWAASYEFDYTRRLRRGYVGLSGSGGFGNMSYSSDNAGISKYWMVDVSFAYDLLKRLTLSGSFNYRRDDFVQSADKHKEDRYLTRIGMDYAIREWLSAGVSYSYNMLDSTLPHDDFTDHRVFMHLTASKDLYRW